MSRLASSRQQDELKRIMKLAFGKFGYSELAKIFDQVIDRCYGEIHAHLAAQDNEAATDESVRLKRLQSQRNLRHGAFLGRQQFESLFFNSDGTVPETISTLPFLLLLGLISDPSAFLNFELSSKP
jgi:hypothetical protein